MIVDTSALLSYFYVGEVEHDAVTAAIESTTEPLVVSPYVLAEVDYLVLTRHGVRHELAVLEELTSGAWELAHMSPGLVIAAADLVRQYADLNVGVADASNIVLAEHWETSTIATLDRRHFTALRLPNGTYPTLVP